VSATIRKDGSIDFSPINSLLSAEVINRGLFLFLKDMDRHYKDFEMSNRLYDLRKSCGVEPPKTTIRIKTPGHENG